MFSLTDSDTFYLYPYPTDMRKRYHIENNACERGMRPVAQGRSAYLFCKNDDTAESTAIVL